MKALARAAAVPKRIMREATAVPKTFAESLAPSEKPRNRPLEKKIRMARSIRAPRGRHAPGGALTPIA
jgi:hypothetical protein